MREREREREREKCEEEEKEARVWEREERNGTVRLMRLRNNAYTYFTLYHIHYQTTNTSTTNSTMKNQNSKYELEAAKQILFFTTIVVYKFLYMR